MVKVSKPTRAAKKERAPIDEVDASETPAKRTWEELVKKAGKATDEEVELFTTTTPATELVRLGASVRSQRLLTDGRRWLGQIWIYWSKLSAKEKSEWIGFSDARFRAVLADFLALKHAYERNAAAPSRTADEARDVVNANALYERGQEVRNTLVESLKQASGGDRALRAAIEAANTTAQEPKRLAKTLNNLVDEARKAAARDAKLARRFEADQITAAKLDEIEKLAVEIDRSGDSGGARAGSPVPQSEIDRLDGVCIERMRGLRAVFNAKKASDRRVPALVPFATRSVFGLGSDSAEPTKLDPGEPTPKG